MRTDTFKEDLVELTKRLIVGVIIATLMSSLVPGLGVSAESAQDYAVNETVSVNVDALNLRANPRLDGNVLSVLSFGTTGVVVDAPVDADGYRWYAITVGDLQGWIASAFLIATGSGGDGGVDPGFDMGDGVRVTALSLNVRTTPGLDGTVFATYYEGETFSVLSEPVARDGYTWYQLFNFGFPLSPSGEAGWVAGEFLAFDPGVSLCEGQGPCPTGLEPGDGARVVTNALNLRDAPGLASNVVAVLDQGTVGVIAEGLTFLDGYAWIAITTNANGTGWVARDFIVGDPSVVGSPEFAAGTAVEVTGGALNLRSGPTIANDVEAVMADGTTLTVEDGPILSDGYAWYQVTSDTYGTGWAAGEFLTAS